MHFKLLACRLVKQLCCALFVFFVESPSGVLTQRLILWDTHSVSLWYCWNPRVSYDLSHFLALLVMFGNLAVPCDNSAFSRVHTHLQKLIEQAEGVHIIETVVTQPVSQFAIIAQLGTVFGLWLVFQVAVGTFPLELLCPSSLQPPTEPAEVNKRYRPNPVTSIYSALQCVITNLI